MSLEIAEFLLLNRFRYYGLGIFDVLAVLNFSAFKTKKYFLFPPFQLYNYTLLASILPHNCFMIVRCLIMALFTSDFNYFKHLAATVHTLSNNYVPLCKII